MRPPATARLTTKCSLACILSVRKDITETGYESDARPSDILALTKGAKVGPVVEPAARVPMQTTPLHERLLRKFENIPTNEHVKQSM